VSAVRRLAGSRGKTFGCGLILSPSDTKGQDLLMRRLVVHRAGLEKKRCVSRWFFL
jgi:hypothetical protein